MAQAIVSMQTFFRTGEFGPVSLGVSRAQLQGCFGEPEAWGPYPKAKHHATVWKYGGIEFHFNNFGTLWLIFSDNVESLQDGQGIDLDLWIFYGGLLVSDALASLSAAGISFQRIDWTLDDDTERYQVGCGIELIFTDNLRLQSNAEGILPVVQPNMTFHGFSYNKQNGVTNGDGTAGKTGC